MVNHGCRNIFVALLLSMVCVGNTFAGYSDSQDSEIIGQTLWFYLNEPECKDNFKIYTPDSSNPFLVGSEAVKLNVLELSKSWIVGDRYYFELLDGSSTKAYAYYRDVNNNRGYTKYLYYEKNTPDLVLLRNACLTNIPPDTKAALIQQESYERKIALESSIEKSKKEYEEKQRIAELKLNEEKLIKEANEKAAAEKAENEKKKQEYAYIKSLPLRLKELQKYEFCDLYGKHIRKNDLDLDNNPSVIKIIANELNRRKIKLNKEMIKKQSIKIGMSTCQLYASWGIPNQENRSVGVWGVHIQHVYGSNQYVYTENNVVTSWQD
jgi:hypothetical protein